MGVAGKAAAVLAVGAVVASVIALWPASAARARTEPGRAAGAAGLTVIREIWERAPGWRAPARCSATAGEPVPRAIKVGARTYRREEGRLVSGKRGGTVRVGLVADSRGATGRTLANAVAARQAFREARVDLVVALGGLGAARDEIEAVLRAVAGEDPPWLVVAIPGDREPIGDFRDAIAQLEGAGLPVVDGSRLGVLVVDGVAFAAMPGVAMDDQGRSYGLVAGVDGCGRTGADGLAVARALGAEEGARVLLSHQPPRQRGAAGSDLSLAGNHVGDVAVADAAREAEATVVVHGFVDEAVGQAAEGGWKGNARGLRARDWGTAVAVAVGALEAAPVLVPGNRVRGGSAAILEVSSGESEPRGRAWWIALPGLDPP